MTDTKTVTGNNHVLVYIEETSGAVRIESGMSLTQAEVKAAEMGLTDYGFAILQGNVVKDFKPEEEDETKDNGGVDAMWSPEVVRDFLTDEGSRDVKLRLGWVDGSRENVWVKLIPNRPDLAILNNTPLFPKYQYMDVVEVKDGYAGDVVYRPYPVVIKFLYQPEEDEEAHTAQRKLLVDALTPFSYSLGFFTAGQGHVDVSKDVDPQDVVNAVTSTGVKIIQVIRQHFDVASDEPTFEHLYGIFDEDGD